MDHPSLCNRPARVLTRINLGRCMSEKRCSTTRVSGDWPRTKRSAVTGCMPSATPPRWSHVPIRGSTRVFRPRLRFGAVPWQVQGHCRPGVWRRPHCHRAPGLPDEPVDRRQTHAGPRSVHLRGEERQSSAFRDIRCHSHSRIRYRQSDGGRIVGQPATFVSRQTETPAVGHRVASVHDEVQERIVESLRVSMASSTSTLDLDCHFDALIQGRRCRRSDGAARRTADRSVPPNGCRAKTPPDSPLRRLAPPSHRR